MSADKIGTQSIVQDMEYRAEWAALSCVDVLACLFTQMVNMVHSMDKKTGMRLISHGTCFGWRGINLKPCFFGQQSTVYFKINPAPSCSPSPRWILTMTSATFDLRKITFAHLCLHTLVCEAQYKIVN